MIKTFCVLFQKMFREKLSAQTGIQIGPSWPDTGLGGVAGCMNWAAVPQQPTPPTNVQSDTNTMYPWELKKYPVAPPEPKTPYPWMKDTKKLPNTPAPDMNRYYMSLIPWYKTIWIKHNILLVWHLIIKMLGVVISPVYKSSQNCQCLCSISYY